MILVFNIPDIVSDKESEEFFRTISYNVKRMRNERGISQLEVALSIGQKSSGFYANTENYKHGKHFNLLHLLKLSKLFDVDIAEFFKPIQ
ncbi:transcriptional regulator, XRE family [Sulfurimonas denitrificans DSM 1251]|uniref:Transcriptional regulator, XRE family n=1 Tax=Sulfurimonas denitrificans (strain ATCC 33889 / DSM 1251) TaxID=326298 RepID=Q30QV1_SULDN|nr:transcriptional regulator, XRE family [Sulfurimonas denitrificans DSM 1251]